VDLGIAGIGAQPVEIGQVSIWLGAKTRSIGQADVLKRAGRCQRGSAMWGKMKSAREGFLRAQFFDDQGVGQGGQLCQTENARGFNGFPDEVASTGWLPAWWLPQGGFPGFRKESSAPRS
jgi:hypothetical protein